MLDASGPYTRRRRGPLRALALVLTVLGLTGCLVVSGTGQAESAYAIAAPPLPVTLPTGALGSMISGEALASMSSAQASSWLAANVGSWSASSMAAGTGGAVTTSGVAAGGATLAAGAVVGTAVVGLGVGYAIGTGVYKGAQWLWGDEHEPNSDVTSSGGALAHDYDCDGASPGTGWCTFQLDLPAVSWYGPGDELVLYDGTQILSVQHAYGWTGTPQQWDRPAVDDWQMPSIRVPSGYTLTRWVLWLRTSDPATDKTIVGEGTWGENTPEPNPERWIEATAECLPPGEELGYSVTAESARFHETDETYPNIPEVACPSGDRLVGLVVREMGGPEPIDILDWHAPEVVREIPATYPGCDVGRCTLDLRRVDPDGSEQSCFESPAMCETWKTDAAADPDEFQCYYGKYPVPLTECDVYGPTFSADPDAPPYAPPDGSPLPDPGPNDQPRDDCPPEFGLLGPLSPFWAYKAVKCALEWAFVPADGYMSGKAADLDAAWSDTPVDQLWGAATGVVGAFDGFDRSGSCEGPGIPYRVWIRTDAAPDGDWHPFSSCAEPAKTMASWVRLLSTVGIWFAALVSGLAAVAGAFGMSVPWRGDEVDA